MTARTIQRISGQFNETCEYWYPLGAENRRKRRSIVKNLKFVRPYFFIANSHGLRQSPFICTLVSRYFVVRINVIPPMLLLDVGGDCIVIEHAVHVLAYEARITPPPARGNSQPALGIARNIRANTLVSLSRANPRTTPPARPFKGRSQNQKCQPSLFRALLVVDP